MEIHLRLRILRLFCLIIWEDMMKSYTYKGNICKMEMCKEAAPLDP